MNEIDVLKRVSSNLTERKSSAALSNYQVLCNNIAYLSNLYKSSINAFYEIQKNISQVFDDDNIINQDYKKNKDLNSFLPIVKRLMLNSFSVCSKISLLTVPDNRNGITVDNVGLLSRGFDEYNDLVTATRQYVDSMVSDAYQLYLLNPKALNYHVLVSLNSFKKFATKSLSSALFNSDVDSALTEFEKIKFKDWNNSPITECLHPTFGQKVDYLIGTTGTILCDVDLSENLKNIFKFSSEFTHIGYVSTFFTSTTGAEVIFGDDTGPYLPSTENFSELKYEILLTACKLLNKLYLPCLIKCLEKTIIPSVANSISKKVNTIISSINEGVLSRNAEYYFFIKTGLVNEKVNIPLTCMCGITREWEYPHRPNDLFCFSCGSSFKLLEVAGDGGYIITSNGPIKIIGSSVPDFKDLSKPEQIKLLQQVAELKKNA